MDENTFKIIDKDTTLKLLYFSRPNDTKVYVYI